MAFVVEGGGWPPPPTRVCNVHLYKGAGSISAGIGLLCFPPIAFQMYQVEFEMELRISVRKWGFCRGDPPPKRVCEVPQHERGGRFCWPRAV